MCLRDVHFTSFHQLKSSTAVPKVILLINLLKI